MIHFPTRPNNRQLTNAVLALTQLCNDAGVPADKIKEALKPVIDGALPEADLDVDESTQPLERDSEDDARLRLRVYEPSKPTRVLPALSMLELMESGQ